MSFTYYSSVEGFVKDELNNRKGDIIGMSRRNAWIRVTSGVGDGMVILSNPNLPLFNAAGAIYGGIGAQSRTSNTEETETDSEITNRNGEPIKFDEEVRKGRPRPIISGIDISEGNNGLSKKMELQITCFTLAQMVEIQKKFQEPGHSVFIEFGWNTAKGVEGLVNLTDTDAIIKQKDLEGVQKQRSSAEGHYDNFLGRITGGSISIEQGERFVVNTKLTGIGDLNAYIQNHKPPTEKEGDDKDGGESFWWVDGTSNDEKRQFQYFFNDLPAYNRTPKLKEMINDEFFTRPQNFVNFDEELREDMGDETVDTAINYNGNKVSIPGNSPLIGEERFVKLDVLFRAVFALKGSKSDKPLPTTENGLLKPIIFEKVPIRAHKRIFSTDKSKLLIPNKDMPDFGFASILKTGEPSNPLVATNDMSYYGVSFPSTTPYDGEIYNELETLNASDWGYLEDLYVNYEFAKSIIESKTNDTYDVYIQILNGLSSAVNNFWNFEIESVSMDVDGKKENRLIIVDKSIACESKAIDAMELVLAGEQSIFLDASLDSSIPGAMLGSVVMGKASDGQKAGNPDATTTAPKTGRGLFTNEPDWITGKLIEAAKTESPNKNDTEKGNDDDKIKSAYAQFQSKAGVYPKLIDSSKDNLDWPANAANRLGFFIFDDPDLLRNVMLADFKLAKSESTQLGQMLLPITFNFTVHGVSGFKRGDKFTVIGLPDAYDIKNGFFQVTQINQQIEGMTWKTQIEGKFRNAPNG